jgi:hypothetical protein
MWVTPHVDDLVGADIALKCNYSYKIILFNKSLYLFRKKQKTTMGGISRASVSHPHVATTGQLGHTRKRRLEQAQAQQCVPQCPNLTSGH